MFHQLSIALRISLLAGFCLLSVVTLLVATSLHQTKKTSERVWTDSNTMLNDAARKDLSSLGEAQVATIQLLLADTYRYGQGLVRELQLLHELGSEAVLEAEPLRQRMTHRVRMPWWPSPICWAST